MAFKELVVVLYVTTIVRTSEVLELNDFVRQFSHLCPFTNYCSKKSTYILSNETDNLCCSECSCGSSTCYQTDKCCPDIEPTPNKLSGLICADSMTKYLNQSLEAPEHNGYSGGIERYFIVDSCPKDYEDWFVDSKCWGVNKTDLGDYLWVSDIQSGIIYQNYHCAKCHDLDDWVTWNFRSTCFIKWMENDYQNITENLLSDQCKLINKVPESKEYVSRRYQCFIPDYTSCNETGHMSIYDPDYESACHSFTHVFVRYHQVGSGLDYAIFKNVFCWLCNKFILDEIPSLCSPEGGGSKGLNLNSERLIALIDYDVLEEVTRAVDTVDRSHCSMVEVYDEYMGQCRELECPLGSLAVDGVCKQIVSDVFLKDGLAIMFIVNIESDWSELTNDQVASQVGQTVAEKIELQLGINTCNNASVEVKNSSKVQQNIELRVLFIKIPSVSCQTDDILKGVLKISGQKSYIQLTQMIRLTATVTLSEKIDYDNGGELIYFRHGSFHNDKGKVDLQLTEPLCPRIKLVYSESLKLKDGKKKHVFLSFFENNETLDETTIVGVCVEDYITAMRHTSGSEKRSLLESTVIFILVETIHTYCSFLSLSRNLI